MRLFDHQLETRVAIAMAVDEQMREFADDLECSDFTSQPAWAVFGAVRNLQASGARAVTLNETCFWLYRRDRAIGIGDGARRDECNTYQPFTPDDAFAALFEAGGLYETLTEKIQAVRQLRALRVRREKLLALGERSESAKRDAVQAEQERRWV